ncbi:MAG: DEAD/DEAH box helicase, partial [Dermabacter sp.]|nr:DEAD/DEAH box helicase [Dermabacter sp.]
MNASGTDLDQLLATAVAAVGGADRPGQRAMASAIERSIELRRHLLVQAGTGTGKSLAYLVPALKRAIDRGTPVVITTATLALQSQIVAKDLPRIVEALGTKLERVPSFSLLKG